METLTIDFLTFDSVDSRVKRIDRYSDRLIGFVIESMTLKTKDQPDIPYVGYNTTPAKLLLFGAECLVIKYRKK